MIALYYLSGCKERNINGKGADRRKKVVNKWFSEKRTAMMMPNETEKS